MSSLEFLLEQAERAVGLRMYKSRLRIWSIFALYVIGAIAAWAADRVRHSGYILLIYLVVAAAVLAVATRKYRPPKYKFELLSPGVVRSPLGFEVRASKSRVEYVEEDHTISWQSTPLNTAVGRFTMSQEGVRGWDPPFADELMDSTKKRKVAQATLSALVYLQLVAEGKIRPKKAAAGQH